MNQNTEELINEKDNSVLVLWWVVGVLVLVIAGYLFVTRAKDDARVETGFEIAPGVFVERSESDISVSDIDLPLPDLSFVPQMETASSDAVKETQKKIKALQKTLKEDPNIFEAWLELGTNYSLLRAYTQAGEVWEFASHIRPTSSLPASNLGFLYGYRLQDQAKAVEYYEQAIALTPDVDYHYIRLFEYYRDIDDMVSARAVIARGVAANPENSVLKEYSNL